MIFEALYLCKRIKCGLPAYRISRCNGLVEATTGPGFMYIEYRKDDKRFPVGLVEGWCGSMQRYDCRFEMISRKWLPFSCGIEVIETALNECGSTGYGPGI